MKLLLLSLLGVGVASAQATSFSGGFTLPSGRIQCQWSDEGTPPALSREVLPAQFRPPTRPADCPLGWGDSLGLGVTDKAYFVCHGDTVFDPLRPALHQSGWARLRAGPRLLPALLNAFKGKSYAPTPPV